MAPRLADVSMSLDIYSVYIGDDEAESQEGGCRGRDSNPHSPVGEQAFKARVSTDSTTAAADKGGPCLPSLLRERRVKGTEDRIVNCKLQIGKSRRGDGEPVALSRPRRC